MSSTSEIGEMWRAVKKDRQARNQTRGETALIILKEKGVKFEKKNFGSHLIVEGKNGKLIDFWPTTGKFKLRGSKNYQGGIEKMLRKYVLEPTQ
jgi:hypothetical protein